MKRKSCIWMIVVVMILQLFLPDMSNVLAADTKSSEGVALDSSEFKVSGTDSFGALLSKEVTGELEEQNSNNGCNIFEITMDDATAIVSMETNVDAVLVVGIYSEDGKQMYSSGITDVVKGETDVFVDIDIEEMPEYYLIRGFLVNNEDYSPLCSAYESPYYTKEMQDFLEKNTEDFDSERVLNFDDDNTNNFAVYNEEVKLITTNDIVNNIISADEETGVYVIDNADETVSGLKPGDIFAGKRENGEELIVKVKSITKQGNTVTITQENTSLDEVFDYVKIDTEGGLSEAQVDESTCDEGVIYNGMTEWKDEIQTYAISGEGSSDIAMSYSWFEKEIGNDNAKATVTGGIDVNINASVKVYISLSYQYLETKIEYNAKIKLELGGKLSGKIKLGQVTISPVPGLYIEFTPSFLVESDIKIELSGQIKGSIGIAYDSETGVRNISSAPSLEVELNIEGTIFIGFSLEPRVKIVSENIASAELEVKAGGEIKGSMALIEADSSALKHDCDKCLDGEVYGKLELNAKISFFKNDKLTWKKSFEIKVKITDFYYSFTHNEFCWDTCPYIKYRVTVSVEDKDGNVIEGAGVYDTYETDENGQAVFYLPNGVYTLKIVKNGYKTVKKNITVKDNEKVVEITLGKSGSSGNAVCNQTLSLGLGHSGVITENGELYMWGLNSYGQIGNGQIGNGIDDNRYISIEIPIKIMDSVRSVSLCGWQSAAITENEELYMWGNNEYGQLGNGTVEDSCNPVKVMENIRSVSLGGYHSGAITENGELYMWGNNEYGQLGNGNIEDSNIPVKIMDGVKSVSLGCYHSAAITEDGKLYMWGNNEYGQLGNGNFEDANMPIKIMEGVRSVSCGQYFSSAITEDGELYMWGNNLHRQLGIETIEYSCIPIKIMENVRSVSCSNAHSGAITEDGELYMWGCNYSGEIGSGDPYNYSGIPPVKIMENVRSVSLGSCQSGAITENGELYMWGSTGYRDIYLSNIPMKIMDNVKLPQEITHNSSTYSISALKNVKTQELLYKESYISTLAEDYLTAEYENLIPNGEYLFYILKSEEGDVLSTDNLLYIEQGRADEYGNLTFSYNLAEDILDGVEKLSGVGKFDTGEIEVVKGDANGDGSMGIKDSAIIKRYLAGWDVEIDMSAADMDGDGKVTIKDSALIKRQLAGWE